jgi:hypothetical protein
MLFVTLLVCILSFVTAQSLEDQIKDQWVVLLHQGSNAFGEHNIAARYGIPAQNVVSTYDIGGMLGFTAKMSQKDADRLAQDNTVSLPSCSSSNSMLSTDSKIGNEYCA